MMKLPANIKAEHWVRNVILSTKQDDLSDLKTLTDAKGDYFCMNKLIYEDIRSDMVRQDILKHIDKEAKVQMAHMAFKTKRSKIRKQKAWRKVLSDVDDTLTCSGGSYPSGIDKRYGKKVVYPGVLGFYRELDLGTDGPEEWPPNTVGNLVFLSARPHLYRDLTEKVNFAKFEKLKARSVDGRSAMHTTPSLLPGDITSGWEYIVKEDFEPLALKKFENFQRYVSIYPEFRHVFVCDNGQGDVRASELMVEKFPKHVEAIYVHRVQSTSKTYYTPEKWKQHGIKPFFFDTYPEAALDAVQRKPPLIRVAGLRRICHDAITDFYMIQTKDWPSESHKRDRRDELNQSLCKCNLYLESLNESTVPLLEAERVWRNGEVVQTPYGTGTIVSFEPYHDLYEVELDWRPLNVQIDEYKQNEKKRKQLASNVAATNTNTTNTTTTTSTALETVFESTEEIDDELRSQSFNSLVQEDSSDGLTKGTVETDKLNKGEDKISSSIDIDDTLVKRTSNDTSLESSNATIDNNNQHNELSTSLKNNDTTTKEESSHPSHPVISKIQGRLIKKFQPLSLPEENNNKSVFSFWGSRSSEASKSSLKTPFNPGDKCSTIYGQGRVKEYRQEDGVVVIQFSNWSATGYLRQDDIEIGGEGFFRSLLRTKRMSSQRSVSTTTKELGFPYVKGTVIQTPYGEGKVHKPLPKPVNNVDQKSIESNNISDINKSTTSTTSFAYQTIGILLVAWMLADGNHPILYVTPQTAFDWKKVTDEEDRSKTSGGILSTFMKLITGKPEKEPKNTNEIPTEIVVPQFERYYTDSANVTTSFGPGIVQSFRAQDGVYEVLLTNWKMMGDVHPKAYLMQDELNYLLADGCSQGFPVLTSLGLSGNLASVQPSTGVHIVTVGSAGMVCYLQPNDVLCPLKAAVGEEVLTPYGEGKVARYRLKDNIYEIDLASGAKLHANVEAIKRVNDGLQDERSFGMKWLLRRIFLLGDNESKGSQRSRSNSITSYRSQSTKSIM